MRKVLIAFFLVLMIALPASALDLEAPAAPDSVISIMPDSRHNLGQGIIEVLADAIQFAYPDLREASAACFCVTVICGLFSLLRAVTEISRFPAALTGATAISFILLRSANVLILLGLDTLNEICEYGKLFFPVLAAALAAQGGVTSSTQLYAATAAILTVLSMICNAIMKPAIYLFLTLSIAAAALPEKLIKDLRDVSKNWLLWLTKGLLTVFTGYMAITGVISGTTDAMALRATRMTISGVIPVVGGILSDASEAVLISAGMVKNTVGIYGFFVILVIVIRPFVRIGIHYLLLKITAGICSVFCGETLSDLIISFSNAMGLILAMVGAAGLMLLVSVVCFLKGAV